MITYERRQLLLEILWNHPGLPRARLAKRLHVSEGTIRNDLNTLEGEGRLERTHGGAVLRKQGQFQNNSFLRRFRLNSPPSWPSHARRLV